MLRYPPWFSPLDCARIDQAVEAAERLQTVDPEAGPVFVIMRVRYLSESVAIEAVLGIMAAVVQTVQRHQSHKPAAILRSTADDLFEQIVLRVGDRSPIRDTLDAWASVVRRHLDTRPSWQQFVDSTTPESAASIGPTPTTSVASPIDDDDPLWSIADAAERLRVSTDTIKRMIKAQTLQTVTVGKRKKIPGRELKRILDSPAWRFPDKSR